MDRHIGDFEVDRVKYEVVHNGHSYKAVRWHNGEPTLGDFATYSTQTRDGSPVLMTHALSGRGVGYEPVNYNDPEAYAEAARHKYLVGEAFVDVVMGVKTEQT